MIKRPLIFVLAAYLAGMYLAWKRLSFVIAFSLMIILILMTYLFLYRLKSRWVNSKDTFLWCLPFLLLLGYFAMISQLKEPELSAAFDQKVSCKVNGTIRMIVKKQKGSAIYLKNNRVSFEEEMPYPCETILVYLLDESELKVGNQITVYGTLHKFSEATNPGQFNERLYYQIENIDYKMEAKEIYVTDAGYSGFHSALGSIKDKLIGVYESILPARESGALIAMLLGEKYLLDDEVKRLYQENGISHVLAISGLHISLIGTFLFWLLKRMKLTVSIATVLTLFFLYCYGIMTNFSISTNRAIVMMGVYLLAAIVGKTYDMLSAMSLSAFLILLQNPMQIFSVGFLLSFGAILGIAIIYPCLKQLFSKKNSVMDSLFLSVSAQLATTPFLLYFYYQLPLYSMITNLIILPFVTMLTLTSILAGIAGMIYWPIGVFLIGGANYILQFYVWVCRLGSRLPYHLITVGQPSALQMILYAILLWGFVWSVRRYQKKLLMILPVLACLLFFLPKNNSGLEIAFLDVGQGEAIYMESENTTYLIDGGSSSIGKLGKYRLQPFLLSKGTDTIDYVIITHSDFDHISGIQELLTEGVITIKTLILPILENKDEAYQKLEAVAKQREIPVRYLKAGDRIVDGDLKIYCLHPAAGFYATSKNSYSTVLSVAYGNFALLLTGDLEQEGEKYAIQAINNSDYWKNEEEAPPLDYNVLKVAHHGSRYSTFEEFLHYVKPELSIISCGRDNKRVTRLIQFRFPCSTMKMA